MAERRSGGLLGPRVLLGALAAIVILAALFTPQEGRPGNPHLSSRSAAAQGARGLAETLGRLGWRVTRRETGYAGALSTTPERGVVHAVLAPPTALRAMEVGALLAAVRAGASLIAVVERDAPLSDSLGYAPSRLGLTLVSRDTAGCPDGAWGRGGAIAWGDGAVHTWWLSRAGTSGFGDTPNALPVGGVDFLEARTNAAPRAPRGRARVRETLFPAARGFLLGRGRVVVIADPDLLRNDVLRVCRWGAGVAAARMMAWLAAAPGVERHVVFDEFHHGPGSRPAPGRVVARALGTTHGGRATLGIAAASLILLAAASVRALPPVARGRVARRSPLEHVDALARAYAQVGASRTVARRLTSGLRRRHGRGTWRGDDHRDIATYLRIVASRHPAIARDADTLRAALDSTTLDARRLAAAAAAVDRALTPRTTRT